MSNLADHLAEQAEITAAHEAEPAPEIEGMECPQCGQREGFHIVATVWGLYHSEGFDQDAPDLPNRDNEWDQYATCICPKCHKSGIVEDFNI